MAESPRDACWKYDCMGMGAEVIGNIESPVPKLLELPVPIMGVKPAHPGL